MKKLSAFLVVLALGLIAVFATGRDTGTVKRTYAQGADISAIEVASIFHVTLREGNETKVEVEVDQDYLSYLSCEVTADGTLSIGLHMPSGNYQNLKGNTTARAVITLQNNDLRSIKLSGMSKLTAGPINSTSEEFQLSVTGMSHFTSSEIHADAIFINLNGMSVISGTKINVDKKVRLKVNGMSKFNNSEINTGELRYDINGMSHVEFSGRAEKVTYSKVQGMSKVNMSKFHN